jgi:hypothetical protein
MQARSTDLSVEFFVEISSSKFMRHGGARLGAGRKKGSGNKKMSADLIARLHLQGLTPLDVMLNTMRTFWQMAQNPDGTIDREKAQAAAIIAKDAAPYVHPRLASMEQKLSGEMHIGDIDAPMKEDRETWLKRRSAAALTLVTGSKAAD